MWPRVLRFAWEWALVVQAVALTAALGGRAFWLLDLPNHAAPWSVAAAALGLVAAVLARARLPAGLLGLALALGAWRVRPLRRGEPDPAFHRVRVLFANVHTSNTDHQALLRWIREEDPDVVGLAEVDDAWLAELGALREGYRWHREASRSDNFGLAVYSRWPANFTALDLSPMGVPSWSVTLPGGATVVVTHPVPPIGGAYAAARDAQLAELAALAGPTTVLVGDLNTTPWSAVFPGPSGWRTGTWPAPFPPFARIPLDHVVAGSGVRLLDLRVGPPIGSDHLPVVADLGLP